MESVEPAGLRLSAQLQDGVLMERQERSPQPCACGCGTLIPVARYPSRQRIFIHNHHARLQTREPLRYQEEDRGYDTPCWIWQGYVTPHGYGQAGRNRGAHRASYEAFVGPIPEGLCLDHLCRIRTCVNPAHLEPVTLAENTRRTRIRFLGGECRYGHSLADGNARVYDGKVSCQTCHRETQRRYVARKRAA